MNLSPNTLTAIAVLVLGVIVLAALDDQRWFRFFRRARNRRRKGVLPPPSHLCERANNEYRLDKPTRGIP